jgi:hypothetical protein
VYTNIYKELFTIPRQDQVNKQKDFPLLFRKEATQPLRQSSEMHAMSQRKGTLLRDLLHKTISSPFSVMAVNILSKKSHVYQNNGFISITSFIGYLLRGTNW